ncbi:Gti1/Pac2 family-domain-containing protein [Crepidotus variabilis]|uniref:Gti1/Pac2 family-domain-containing protein n=1 Tax=Crepidotus variabilis TaxID=179855 RepID=A0A9P6JP65_9AGAR|nr:Gti1/Pac2 family-domain-containing protein [Crepidotus variabilis]
MQRATLTGIRIRSPSDARVIFHSVYLNILPMVTRRLDTEERSLISSGSVYVWEERGQHTELTGVGIERWTDGIRWGPSRVREGFLFYHEKPATQHLSHADGSFDPMRSVLIKQTYTVFVDTPRGQRKWHLIAYFTEETVHRLRSIDDIVQLNSVTVPSGLYKSARSAKGRPDHIFGQDSEGSAFAHLEYVPYAPPGTTQSPSPGPSTAAELPHNSLSSWTTPPQDHRRSPTSRPSSSLSNSSAPDPKILVPLSYLEEHPPPRRHPTDEKLLMMLTTRCFRERQNWLHGSSAPKHRPI